MNHVNELRNILTSLHVIGKQGMKPSFDDWSTFHDKVAERAEAALESLEEITKQLKEIENTADTSGKCIITADEEITSMSKLRDYYGAKFMQIKKLAKREN